MMNIDTSISTHAGRHFSTVSLSEVQNPAGLRYEPFVITGPRPPVLKRGCLVNFLD